MILIIGSPQEEHSAFIAHKLMARGATPFFLNTLQFPGQLKLSLYPDAPQRGSLCVGQDVLKLTDIQSVYWRYHMGVQAGAGVDDPFLREMAVREIESALGSLFYGLNDDCLWVNGPAAIEQHRYKAYQTQRLKRAGLRVPETLVSNDPQAVQAFFDAQNGQVIYKPVRGGAHTKKLSPEDLTPARLAELAKAPVQFQEYIPGVDIRVYLVGDELFPAEIQTTAVDFRDDPQAKIVPVELPEHLQADCHTLAQSLGLHFSGIDVRRTPEGEYVFLEGNPSPMFIHFENMSGFPISDRLVDLLIEGR